MVFRRSAATKEARSGRAEVSDARRPRNRENGDDALTRAADARPRGREWGGALAVPLRDLRRSATRRGEKTRATGEAFGVDARRSPRRRGTGTRAYLGDPRVEIQTLPHDRPRASSLGRLGSRERVVPTARVVLRRGPFARAASAASKEERRDESVVLKKPHFTRVRFTALADSFTNS